MANIHDAIKEDDVSGTIIGGDHVSGSLVYDGRVQYGVHTADNEPELLFKLKAMMDEIKNDCGEVFSSIYPLDAWEIRIYY